MKSLKERRQAIGISQRVLAILASVSYKTIQLIERGSHDPKFSTLTNIAKSLGYPPNIIDRHLEYIFGQPVDSISIVSERILSDGEDSWKIWLFEFVDAFRKKKNAEYINKPPADGLSVKMNALVTSIVETLCDELGIATPVWCNKVPPLTEPWFVAETENLKAIAITESPIHFRKRNIFVLGNFLSRR